MSELIEAWVKHVPPGRALDLGAGEGATARWLAMHGFSVDAVERDPATFERLAVASTGAKVQPHLTDLLSFAYPPSAYSLIIAEAVLHFLRPTELWLLADHLSQALIPGGVLVAEVFTTDDPGFEALREAGAVEIEPNTFQTPEPIGIIHYFTPGELRRVFTALEVLAYEEARRLDPDSIEGYRAGASLIARRSH